MFHDLEGVFPPKLRLDVPPHSPAHIHPKSVNSHHSGDPFSQPVDTLEESWPAVELDGSSVVDADETMEGTADEEGEDQVSQETLDGALETTDYKERVRCIFAVFGYYLTFSVSKDYIITYKRALLSTYSSDFILHSNRRRYIKAHGKIRRILFRFVGCFRLSYFGPVYYGKGCRQWFDPNGRNIVRICVGAYYRPKAEITTYSPA